MPGFATYDQLPRSKGWDYFYGYLGKAIGYFDGKSFDDCPNVGNVDLWENGMLHVSCCKLQKQKMSNIFQYQAYTKWQPT